MPGPLEAKLEEGWLAMIPVRNGVTRLKTERENAKGNLRLTSTSQDGSAYSGVEDHWSSLEVRVLLVHEWLESVTGPWTMDPYP